MGRKRLHFGGKWVIEGLHQICFQIHWRCQLLVVLRVPQGMVSAGFSITWSEFNDEERM